MLARDRWRTHRENDHGRRLEADERPAVVARQRRQAAEQAGEDEVRRAVEVGPACQEVDRGGHHGEQHDLAHRRAGEVERVRVGDDHERAQPGGAHAAGDQMGEAEGRHREQDERRHTDQGARPMPGATSSPRRRTAAMSRWGSGSQTLPSWREPVGEPADHPLRDVQVGLGVAVGQGAPGRDRPRRDGRAAPSSATIADGPGVGAQPSTVGARRSATASRRTRARRAR